MMHNGKEFKETGVEEVKRGRNGRENEDVMGEEG